MPKCRTFALPHASTAVHPGAPSAGIPSSRYCRLRRRLGRVGRVWEMELIADGPLLSPCEPCLHQAGVDWRPMRRSRNRTVDWAAGSPKRGCGPCPNVERAKVHNAVEGCAQRRGDSARTGVRRVCGRDEPGTPGFVEAPASPACSFPVVGQWRQVRDLAGPARPFLSPGRAPVRRRDSRWFAVLVPVCVTLVALQLYALGGGAAHGRTPASCVAGVCRRGLAGRRNGVAVFAPMRICTR